MAALRHLVPVVVRSIVPAAPRRSSPWQVATRLNYSVKGKGFDTLDMEIRAFRGEVKATWSQIKYLFFFLAAETGFAFGFATPLIASALFKDEKTKNQRCDDREQHK